MVFFVRKLFQSTRLYIKGILRWLASKCARQGNEECCSESLIAEVQFNSIPRYLLFQSTLKYIKGIVVNVQTLEIPIAYAS